MPAGLPVDDIVIRRAAPSDLAEASALCLRSKANWGYDAAFMAACRDELTLAERDLADIVLVASQSGRIVGVIQLSQKGEEAEIEKLFVDPSALRQGLGHQLLHAAMACAPSARIRVQSDPGAAAFYRAQGFEPVGERPSGSISGRMLPVLVRRSG